MFGLGVTELVIILAIVLLFFGAGKLPRVMTELGKGMAQFKKAVNGEEVVEEKSSKDQKTLPKKATPKKKPARKKTTSKSKKKS